MSLDRLLLWLSAKGQGSWSQFRGAVEALCVEQDYEVLEITDNIERDGSNGSDLPVYQRCRFALQRLGHVEFFSNGAERGWRVVPPAVALLSNDSGEGVLCGARFSGLLERLDRVDDLDVTRTDAVGMPQRIVIRGNSQSVALAASRFGLLVQANAATAILSAVPVVRDPAAWRRTVIPETQGWTVNRFSSSRLGWTKSTTLDAMKTRTGFFQFLMKHQRFYYLRWHGHTYSVPVQVGKYVVMRRKRGLIAYDATNRALSLPASCRPPLLIERALVLCSGLLPAFDASSRRLEYTCIPPSVARLASQLLWQEVR